MAGSGRRQQSRAHDCGSTNPTAKKHRHAMQTLILVHCLPGPSLRQQITTNLQNSQIAERYGLELRKQQKPGRNPGWSLLAPSAQAVRGTLRLEWHDNTPTLFCRLVTKRSDELPNELAGLWLRYLFAEHGDRIRAVLIMPSCSNNAPHDRVKT